MLKYSLTRPSAHSMTSELGVDEMCRGDDALFMARRQWPPVYWSSRHADMLHSPRRRRNQRPMPLLSRGGSRGRGRWQLKGAKKTMPASGSSTGGRLSTTRAPSTWLPCRTDYLLMIFSTERSVRPVSEDELASVRAGASWPRTAA